MMIGNHQDMTERKQEERTVQDSRDFFNAILNTLGDPVFVKDRQHRLIFVNDAVCRLFGRPREEIIGRTAYDLFPDREMADISWQKDEEVFTTGLENVNEEMNTYGPGRTRNVVVRKTPFLDHDGHQFLVGIASDITDRKKAYQLLQASETRYRRLFETAQDGILILDEKSGMIIDANRYILDMLGYTLDYFVGKQLWELGFIRDKSFAKKAFDELKKNTYIRYEDLPLETKDGKGIDVEFVSNVYLVNDHKVIQCNIRDITDRKRAEEALKIANKKLNLLGSSTRHDITNQLMVVNGYLEMLRKKLPEPAFGDYFNRVERASAKISAIIQFSKTYEQIGINTPAWQDIRSMVNDVARDIISGVNVVNDLPARTEVFADPMLGKVFFNLLDNSLRHGQQVTMIRVLCQRLDGGLVIVWEDNGAGIPEDEKELIFQRGYGKNTGFGLFLAREILAITGITVTETGDPGRGARFEMVIPDGVYRWGGNP
jgi:PAS domain S-box-containing protein